MDTAFTYVAGRAWRPLFAIVGFTLVVANFGSGMGAQLGAARLLYGMGRSSALPKSFFGVVDPKRHVPRNNVLFVGALALAGAFLLPWVAAVPAILGRFVSSGYLSGTTTSGYELGANLLNFGALIAFMGVNAAAFVRYYLREDKKKLTNLLPPALGFLICLFLWLSLSTMALIFGAIWMAVGIAFGAWKTQGFRRNLVNFELPPDE
jgi:amino acid transporter